MSIAIMAQCWPVECRQTLKLLLLALADNADDDGLCWPSIDTIARKCCTDRRNVFRQLGELEALGQISREQRSGHSNLYHVHPIPAVSGGNTATGGILPPVANSHPPVVTVPPKGVVSPPPTRGKPATQNHHEPSSEPPKNRTGRAAAKTAMPDGFAISDGVRKWAEGKGHADLDAHFESFVRKCSAKGYTYANWDQAFQNAIIDNWARLKPAGGIASDYGKGVDGEGRF